jgi:hypothetical protein
MQAGDGVSFYPGRRERRGASRTMMQQDGDEDQGNKPSERASNTA